MSATTAELVLLNSTLELEHVTPQCHFATSTQIELKFTTELAAEQALSSATDVGKHTTARTLSYLLLSYRIALAHRRIIT